MTKKEIVKTISEEIGLTQLKTKEIVQKTFDAIVETLVEERRIELRNFGVFEVKLRKARQARNPRTGEKLWVPEKRIVTFKSGKEMEERIPFALAEYNAGYGNVLRWLPQGQETAAEEFVVAITFPTVRDYVTDVMESYEFYKARGRL